MSFFETRAELLKKSNETDELKYGKVSHSTGAGARYEERMVALVFLRCLRRGVRFTLSANDGAGGKFGRIVLCWEGDEAPGVSALFVQLKHKTSTTQTTIRRANLAWRKGDESKENDFAVGVLRESYAKVSASLEGGSYALVLSTNVDLDPDAWHMFVEVDADSVGGVELLASGGRLYRLDPGDGDAEAAAQGDQQFMRDFYLFCGQSDWKSIWDWVCAELGQVLGADEDYRESACDDLCSRVREWMNGQSVCLTRKWKSWLEVVDAYVKEKVTECDSVVTGIKFRSVEKLRAHVEGCNPAWVRPLGSDAAALTATRVHQAVCGEGHILVRATRLTELEQKILCCWGHFCRWLIIVDDAEHSSDALLRMGQLSGPQRRLVIVSYKRDDSYLDTCESSDICDESWKELIDVDISLNGEKPLCRLEGLCDTEALKVTLDGKPEALVALSQLPGPLRLGQGLDPLPENHIPRQLTCRTHIAEEFFSALGDKEICITDEASYKLLIDKPVMMNSVRFEELEKYLGASDVVWPLFVVTDNVDFVTVKMICGKYVNIQVYVLSFVDDGWQILFVHGDCAKIRQYVEEQSKSVLQIMNGPSSRIIVEGKPGVGKSTLLLHLARQLKEENPSWWVVTIDLFECSDVLDGCESGVEASKGTLIRAVYNENKLGILEHSLLQHCLVEYPRIICLVDNFVEDSPDYTEKCLQALQELAPRRGKTVVTTRPSSTGRLESALGVLTHSLPPFSEEELRLFHRWCNKETGVTEAVRDLLKIPLFSKMFSGPLQSGAKAGDIVSLYSDFFERNFKRMYEEKWGDDLYIPGKKRKYHKERLEHEKQLGFLALSHLVPELEVSYIKQWPSIDKGDIVKSGIVYQFIDDRPVFIHRTFAEHFLAKWCFLDVADGVYADVYRKAISDSSLEFFVESFDRMACRGRPLLTAIVNGSESEVEFLLQMGADPAEADAMGRSALHLAAAYSSGPKLMQLVVEGLEAGTSSAWGPAEVTQKAVKLEVVSERDEPVKSADEERITGSGQVANHSGPLEAFGAAASSGGERIVASDGPSKAAVALAAEDGLLRWTPLRYAAERRRWGAAEVLLSAGAWLSHLGDFRRRLHDPQQLWDTFQKGGYEALVAHILQKNCSQVAQQRLESKNCLEIEVALSVACAEMSAEQYEEIQRAAASCGDMEVAKLLRLKVLDMEKKTVSTESPDPDQLTGTNK